MPMMQPSEEMIRSLSRAQDVGASALGADEPVSPWSVLAELGLALVPLGMAGKVFRHPAVGPRQLEQRGVSRWMAHEASKGPSDAMPRSWRRASQAASEAPDWTRTMLEEAGAHGVNVDQAGGIRGFFRGPYVVQQSGPGYRVSKWQPGAPGDAIDYGVQPSIDAVLKLIDTIGMD